MARPKNERTLTLYLRILAYLRPYTRYILLVLMFNFLFVIFNTLSVWMVAPVVGALFQSDTVEQRVEGTDTPAPEPLPVDGEGEDTSLNINNWLKDQLYGYIYRDDRTEMLQVLCLFIFFTFALKNLFAFFEFFWVSLVEQRVIKDLREEVYGHILRQPLAFFSDRQTGELISRITNDINAVNVAVNRSFTKIIRDPILILLLLILLVSISPSLTLLAMVVFPLSAYSIQKIGKSLKRKSRRVQERIAGITTVLQETISGIKVVKAFAMEGYENERFQSETGRHFRAVLRQIRLQRLASPLSETLGVGVMASVIWFGGQMVLKGEMLTSEDFIRFVILLFAIMEPIKSLGNLQNNIQVALASGTRIFDILDTPVTITDHPEAVAKSDFREAIHFRGVGFRYQPRGERILDDVTLEVRRNEKIALVGSSGAGKTTLVNLLPRFYDVVEGRIDIDGIDIRRIRVSDLRRLMGIVTQEVILFNDTIANNIAYGLANYSRTDIVRAAELANAREFIEHAPDGFETMIGERGVLLSGGQRQRLSIARAILKDPPILIFDEATSSLDSESEFLILEAIENLMKDRTVFMIAHRLSSIIHSDKIVLLENGRVMDVGRHAELLERSDRYRRLCEFQFAQ